ncbi:MAG: chemoreceptor glutamine deamidase CheD [Pseudomonadota bacterium]
MTLISSYAHQNMQLPALFPGFESINRYWDKTHKRFAAKILPGEYFVTAEDEIIVTVLGSCVSACVRDKIYGIGGMNHFMLPASSSDMSHHLQAGGNSTEATRYGGYAMEMLINDILKYGGRRENLEIKIFGGGRIIKSMTDVGRRNVEFIGEYIKNENLALISGDTGDIYPRKVVFHPNSGKVKVKRLQSIHNETLIHREETYQHQLEDKPSSGEVELF